MTRILLCTFCLFTLSCAVPVSPPPGMPLDGEHRDEDGDIAITKITR